MLYLGKALVGWRAHVQANCNKLWEFEDQVPTILMELSLIGVEIVTGKVCRKIFL